MDLSKPVKKCTADIALAGVIYIHASDNENLVTLDENSRVSKISTLDFSTLWSTQIGGKPFGDLFITKDFEIIVTTENTEDFLVSVLDQTFGLVKQQRKFPKNLYNLIYKFEDRFTFLVTPTKLSLLITKDVNSQDNKIRFPNGFSDVTEIIVSTDQMKLLVSDQTEFYLFDLISGNNYYQSEYRSSLTSFLALSNNLFLLGDKSGFVKLFDIQGKNIWKFKTGGTVKYLFRYKNYILAISDDNFIYMFAKNDGKIIWKAKTSGRVSLQPLIYDNYLILSGQSEGSASVLDLRNGNLLNKIDFKIDEDNVSMYRRIVLFPDLLILLTKKGLSTYRTRDC